MFQSPGNAAPPGALGDISNRNVPPLFKKPGKLFVYEPNGFTLFEALSYIEKVKKYKKILSFQKDQSRRGF